MQIQFKDEQFEIGRVVVLLGANGSGKSTELKKISNSSNGEVFYIEGGRTIGLPSRLDTLIQDGQDLASFEREYNESKKTSIHGRIHRRLGILYKKAIAIDLAWARLLKSDPKKVNEIPKTKIDELIEMFNEIFPEITLNINEATESIEAVKSDGKPYSIASLSDGEKQSFAIMLDLMILETEPSIVIVDEPEINLHPYLAINLWNAVERKLPNTVFIYGTHLIQFALRESVSDIIALSGKYRPVKIEPDEWIHSDYISELLFALPGVFASSKVLFCEGRDKYQSEKMFYEWLINDKTIRVEPLSGRDSVIAASNKAEIFEKISTGISVAGVVDSDNRGILQKLPKNVKELPFHEFETVFCLPSVFSKIVNSLNEKLTCTEDTIKSDICEWVSLNRRNITSQYMSYRLGFRVGVSIAKSDIIDDDIVAKYDEIAKKEIIKVTESLSILRINEMFEEVNAIINKLIACDYSNFEDQCRLIIGKECLQALCAKYKVKKQRVVSRGLMIIKPDSVQKLLEFKNELIKEIG